MGEYLGDVTCAQNTPREFLAHHSPTALSRLPTHYFHHNHTVLRVLVWPFHGIIEKDIYMTNRGWRR